MKSEDFRELQRLLSPDRVLTAEADKVLYHSDETNLVYVPDAVVFPETAEEVAAVLRLANVSGFPVVPRGAGSGLTGGALPVHGGVLLVMTRMDQILEIDEANLDAIVQPGVILEDFQKAVEEKGLFYPPDPNSLDTATLGGNVAENAGGPRTIKYGVTRDYVLGLEVVLPTGEIIRTGSKCRKDVAGYDLTRLIIGSEGTLGVVTEITVRLIAKPEAVRTLVALFPDFEDAAKAVAAIMGRRVAPCVLEFVDAIAVKLVRDFLKMSVSTAVDCLLLDAGPQAAFLLAEVDGPENSVDEHLAMVESVCREFRVGDVQVLRTEKERERIWTVRRNIKNAIKAVCKYEVSEDIVVPISRVPTMVRKLQDIAAELGVEINNYGHFGDGNIHVNILSYEGTPELMERVQATVPRVFAETAALGGSISGEHGVGVTKAPYLEAHVGAETLAVYRKIKRALDPKNILNPGKMALDEEPSEIPHGNHRRDQAGPRHAGSRD